MHPKPFIRLTDGQSLLQKAFLRGADLPDVREIITVTNRDLFFKTQDDYLEINEKGVDTTFILEPFGRNTSAAIASAALYLSDVYGPDAMMLILAADHLISDQAAFVSAVKSAVVMAEQGSLVTFGIQPGSPETGYGYIEADGNTVLRFVEKPSMEKAREYLASGKYLWNSGMFCFKASAILKEMETYCPEILSATKKCLSQSRTLKGTGYIQVDLEQKTFGLIPDNSIDYAVMEQSQQVSVVPCDLGWSDVGSWVALGDLTAADVDGNRIEGEALLYDVSNCYVQSNKRVIGAVGVDNLIIVDTSDALLVADKSRAQDVKHLFAALKKSGNDAYKLHQTAHRPWGTYTVLEEDAKYKIKRIEVKPGASLSLQMHHHRSEHWIVVSGMAKVVNGDRELFISTNESTFIPAGHKHRLENPGILNLVMIEVQSGQYLGEDDIVRFEDKYGRS
ncbi:mannose-1-phosphate guanylyltransferase/mannose-6-phosphate isomerase [Undibacterium sp. 10I3]|uniref:mannose-1-phosphate guanylyltransferase/mannose-6-phosphate isomerase n=1 Tax=Undibacterium sp. 10I3 TaxID=3048579 RepID=UPI002B22E1A8|nr:mannose-1-phosphate guanylyltransferase/mannose-6-phosphate isomerase [Undibacterium sp. 10I3]MEB0230362.1 mannose-1-phosphate guanylyltransferase/mannose-6-phosphate isomerase [Undibacterium sp. 10I3]